MGTWGEDCCTVLVLFPLYLKCRRAKTTDTLSQFFICKLYYRYVSSLRKLNVNLRERQRYQMFSECKVIPSPGNS